MSKKRFGIQFKGFNELMEELDGLGGDLKEVANECLQVSNKMITPKLHLDMERHKQTGKTEKSIVENARVEWEGTTASIDVGFKISNGGLPSIFLMYGTPRIKKDTKLYNDIYGSKIKKEIAEEQEKILQKAIKKRLGG